jgi:hypothetical protein
MAVDGSEKPVAAEKPGPAIRRPVCLVSPLRLDEIGSVTDFSSTNSDRGGERRENRCNPLCVSSAISARR